MVSLGTVAVDYSLSSAYSATQRGNDGGLPCVRINSARAKLPENRRSESAAFRIGPPTLRPSPGPFWSSLGLASTFCRGNKPLALKASHANRLCVKQSALSGLTNSAQHRHRNAPGLLRAFQRIFFLPSTRSARFASRDQGPSSFAPARAHDRAHSQLGAFSIAIRTRSTDYQTTAREIHAGVTARQTPRARANCRRFAPRHFRSAPPPNPLVRRRSAHKRPVARAITRPR